MKRAITAIVYSKRYVTTHKNPLHCIAIFCDDDSAPESHVRVVSKLLEKSVVTLFGQSGLATESTGELMCFRGDYYIDLVPCICMMV